MPLEIAFADGRAGRRWVSGAHVPWLDLTGGAAAVAAYGVPVVTLLSKPNPTVPAGRRALERAGRATAIAIHKIPVVALFWRRRRRRFRRSAGPRTRTSRCRCTFESSHKPPFFCRAQFSIVLLLGFARLPVGVEPTDRSSSSRRPARIDPRHANAIRLRRPRSCPPIQTLLPMNPSMYAFSVASSIRVSVQPGASASQIDLCSTRGVRCFAQQVLGRPGAHLAVPLEVRRGADRRAGRRRVSGAREPWLDLTHGAAPITTQVVSVVTFFAKPHPTVPAGRSALERAGRAAAVAIREVPVVTLLRHRHGAVSADRRALADELLVVGAFSVFPEAAVMLPCAALRLLLPLGSPDFQLL